MQLPSSISMHSSVYGAPPHIPTGTADAEGRANKKKRRITAENEGMIDCIIDYDEREILLCTRCLDVTSFFTRLQMLLRCNQLQLLFLVTIVLANTFEQFGSWYLVDVTGRKGPADLQKKVVVEIFLLLKNMFFICQIS